MNGLVAAFSAGASDMSAWVLMGLPGSICLYGLGQVWISIGLLIGTICAWLFVAPKLRRFAIIANDSITIPQFLSNRFMAKNPILRISCAVIFVIAYCVYTASSLSACGELFNVVMGIEENTAMIIAAGVILVYTLLGGFNAVCWTDFFQGLIMLAALMFVPIIALFLLNGSGPIGEVITPEHYYSFLSSGKFDWKSIADILSGLGWGLGYFGMPHILVRYMAIRSEKEMKKSQIIGIIWITIILFMATVVGIVGHMYLGNNIDGTNKSQVFIKMVRQIFGVGALALIGGLMLSAIVAAAMSTADSQLLASSSSFASDIYKTTIKKNATDKEMLWVGRITVAAVLIVAILIAVNPASGGIMALVESAWAIFGSAFGPAVILALFWRRFNYTGAVTGIITGFVVSVFWMFAFNKGDASLIANTGLYELVPGFILGLISAVIVTLLTKKPSEEVVALFDSVKPIADQE
jgi:sodium/proline symporter